MAKEEKKKNDLESVEVVKTSEKKEPFEDIENKFKKEVEKQISDFKDGDKEKIEMIEKSAGLDDGVVEEVKKELKVEETLEDLNKKAETLDYETFIQKREELILNIKRKIENDSGLDNKQINILTKIFKKEEDLERAIFAYNLKLENRYNLGHLDDYKLLMEMRKVEIMQIRSDIFILKNELGENINYDSLENVKKNILELEKIPRGKIAGRSNENKKEDEFYMDLDNSINDINFICDKYKGTNYSIKKIFDFEYSDNLDEKKLFDEVKLKLEQAIIPFEKLEQINSRAVFHKIMSSVTDGFIKHHFFSLFLDNENISFQEIIETYVKNSATWDTFGGFNYGIKIRLLIEKRKTLINLPIEEVLVEWENDIETFDRDNCAIFYKKIANKFENMIRINNVEEIHILYERLEKLSEKSSYFHISECFPVWLEKMNINTKDSLQIMTKELSEKSFRYYLDQNSKSFINLNLLPEYLTQEEKESYGKRLFYKEGINNFDVQDLLKTFNKNIESFEIQSIAINGLLYNLSSGNYDEAINIKNLFNISKNNCKPVILNYLISNIGKFSREDSLVKILDDFDIKEYNLNYITQAGFLDYLEKGYVSGVLKIKENFNISEEFLTSPKVMSIVERLLLENLEKGDMKQVFYLKNVFNLYEDGFNLLIEKLFNKIKNQENGEIKLQSFKNIQDSFLVNQNKEKLPEKIKVVLDRFENQYGNKGKNLIALAISAYGIENPESFERKMKNIENIINKYNPDTMPDGVKTSIGIEYEVTGSIGKLYDKNSYLGYIKDIELVSKTANIGKGGGGSGAIYEFTTKPTYNPYLLMAEMKILQDAGFIDLNFEKYQQASRGYHLSLVGDSGISVDQNMYFLNNMMTMAQLTGITAGEDISSTKGIYSKTFEHFSDVDQKGSRCEMKGMATDSVEQFEKTVITAHNAGIAIQLSNRYLGEGVFPDNFSNVEEFEKKLNERGLLQKPFESNQERDIVYEWVKLKNSAVESINQHNESFINNEFNGLSLDKNGELVDITDHILVKENEERLVNAKITKEELINEIRMNSSDLFSTQSSQLVNALSKTFNFFIFKAIHPDDGQYITIEQPDGTEKKIINLSNVVSIFNMKDEGYKTRDKDTGSDDRKKSIFDFGNEIRDGYYNIGNASEEMIIHKSQIILNRFNKRMEELLSTKGEKRKIEVEEDNLVNA